MYRHRPMIVGIRHHRQANIVRPAHPRGERVGLPYPFYPGPFRLANQQHQTWQTINGGTMSIALDLASQTFYRHCVFGHGGRRSNSTAPGCSPVARLRGTPHGGWTWCSLYTL